MIFEPCIASDLLFLLVYLQHENMSIHCHYKRLKLDVFELSFLLLYFLKPKKTIGRKGCDKDTAADGDTFRSFEIEAILMPDFHLVLLG